MQQYYSSLPEQPGVYIFKNQKGQILYVGKANNLHTRVSSYLGKKAKLGPKTSLLVSQIAGVDYTVVSSELEALLLEANLIKKYKPPFNVRWTDGKAYPFIKITVNDTYPAVLQSRKIDDPNVLFFGPFPNIGDVRRILKWVRRIFPYQAIHNHPKRICLYYHLGLCPCPPLLQQDKLAAYKRTISQLIQFLEGKKERVVKSLAREMEHAAKREDFEEAQRIKQQIDTLILITAPIHAPQEYMSNPNLASDEASKDLESLRAVLSTHFRGSTPKTLSRIECYDISNIQGKAATGSMVVATDGQIDKTQYRRFKIKFKDTPDDVAMMREMLTRRLRHTEWSTPDLIVVDGGVNQVNAATDIMKRQKVMSPVIGLAKRLEEIVIPASQGETLDRRRRDEETRTIRLSRNHRALKLLQRLRDEAHRFAISYHRKLRQKRLFNLT